MRKKEQMEATKAKQLLRFEQVRQKALAQIQDSILESMARVEESGYRNISISRFPSFAMIQIGKELEASGFEVEVECQPEINKVALNIRWD